MLPVTIWEMKNITETNIRQYERGMPYLFFIKSENKPMQTEIRGYKNRKNENNVYR